MAYQPKSYKKFVATAATATLVATAVVPAAFADDVTTAAFTDVAPQYKAAVDFVVEQAIAKGISETQFGISKEIIRGDAAIMIANAAKLNDPTAPASGFTDVPTRGALAINSLKAAGVTNGKTATSFDFSGDITRGEAAVFLANAFELEGDVSNVKFTDVNSRYMAAVAALVDNGVTAGKSATKFGTDDNITRGEFARWIFALEEYIVDETPATPAVVSVTAPTLDSVVVEFNRELDETTALQAKNYKVGSKSFTDADISINSDGKSVTIDLTDSELTDGESYRVQVSNVKDVNGDVFPAFDEVIKVEDNTAPTVVSSEYIHALNELTVQFSEKVPTTGTVKLTDSEGVSQTASIKSSDDDELVIDTSGLDRNETYRLTMVGAKDLAGNFFANNFVTLSFTTSTADTVKPTVESVKLLSNDLIEVTVSEKLSAAGKLNGTNLTLDAKLDAVNDYKVSSNGLVYTIKVAKLTNNTVNNFAFSDQVDLAGNKITPVTKVVSYLDETAPSVVSVTETNKVLTVVFSEPVVDPTVGGTLVSPDGVQYTVGAEQISLDATDTTNRTLTINLTSDVTGTPVAGNYVVSFNKGVVKDAEGNSQALTVSSPLTVSADETKPEVKTFGYTTAANNGKVTLTYSKDMGASAINAANYTVDGVKVFDSAYFDASKKAVVLTIKDGAFEFSGEREFKVTNVSALDGTALPTYTKNQTFVDNTSPELLKAELELGSTEDEIILSFNEALNLASVTDDKVDFAVYVGDQKLIGATENVDNSNVSGYSYKIDLNTKLTAEQYGQTITVRPTTDIDVADTAGNFLEEFTSITVTK